MWVPFFFAAKPEGIDLRVLRCTVSLTICQKVEIPNLSKPQPKRTKNWHTPLCALVCTCVRLNSMRTFTQYKRHVLCNANIYLICGFIPTRLVYCVSYAWHARRNVKLFGKGVGRQQGKSQFIWARKGWRNVMLFQTEHTCVNRLRNI